MYKIVCDKERTGVYDENKKRVSLPHLGTKGSFGFVKLDFEFDSIWDGLEKIITFWPEGGSANYAKIIPASLSLIIDSPVATKVASAKNVMVIAGYKNGALLNSVNITYFVSDSKGAGTQTQPTPSPDVIGQILAQTAEDRKVCVEAAAAASHSSSNACEKAGVASEEAITATQQATQASNSAKAAQTAAELALNAVDALTNIDISNILTN